MKNNIINKVLLILITMIIVFFVIFVVPISPHRIIKEIPSPDQTKVAIFSWKPAGVFGVYTKSDPWVYLRIQDTATKKILAEHSTWGDVPDDGIRLLSKYVSWYE